MAKAEIKRLHITAKRVYDTRNATRLEWNANGEKIGFINYSVTTPQEEAQQPYGRVPVGKRHLFDKDAKIGIINDTYINQEEYRGKGVLAAFMRFILCDMKCRGASKVTLDAASSKIWGRFGFTSYHKFESRGDVDNPLMMRGLEDLDCDCHEPKTKVVEKEVEYDRGFRYRIS